MITLTKYKLTLPLLLFLLLICRTLLSKPEQDSLNELIKTLPDSLKSEIYIRFISSNYRSMPDICLLYAQETIKLSKELKQMSALAKAYSLSGVIYKNKGDYSTALSFHHQSLYINEELGLKEELSTNYNDIGIIYKTIGEYDKALESYTLSNSLATQLNLNRGIIMTLNNIGTIYEAKGNMEYAIEYYNRAYRKAIDFNILDAQAIILNNLGDIYASKGDNEIAKQYFKETLQIDLKTGDKIGSVYSMLNVAGTMLGSKQYDSSIYYYNQAINLAEEFSANQLLFFAYNGLSGLYHEMGDYKNAFETLQQVRNFQDSLYIETRVKQLAEVESKYEAIKKDNEIQHLKQDQLIKEIEIQQHKAERIALLSLLVLGAIIIFYLYKRYKLKQNYTFNQKLIRQKEEHLIAIVETQEKERKRIAKDLHDGVGQALSTVKLALSSLAQLNEVSSYNTIKFKEISTIVDHACIEVRTISHQMMPRILQEDGLVPALADMLEKSFQMSIINYEFEHFGIDCRFKENIEVGLYRICQELINNIIKHSGANIVNVQLIKNNSLLVLLVEDNGKGFSFRELKSKGMGLMNISSRVETIHGEFNLGPSPESGTLATIRIPII
ncbi:MAG: hypothetical protein CVT92_06660 [Bacteroidetes bacterium HGW-Bacteroidetes-1]|jgi:signal transduction histidine kinase|nr:MAG: hypothetical protein CVT92_06660 [Bacteroidetes bacterium HGW-Bacteroidetes-1]